MWKGANEEFKKFCWKKMAKDVSVSSLPPSGYACGLPVCFFWISFHFFDFWHALIALVYIEPQLCV
jgi:hypothetical protein